MANHFLKVISVLALACTLQCQSASIGGSYQLQNPDPPGDMVGGSYTVMGLTSIHRGLPLQLANFQAVDDPSLDRKPVHHTRHGEAIDVPNNQRLSGYTRTIGEAPVMIDSAREHRMVIQKNQDVGHKLVGDHHQLEALSSRNKKGEEGNEPEQNESTESVTEQTTPKLDQQIHLESVFTALQKNVMENSHSVSKDTAPKTTVDIANPDCDGMRSKDVGKSYEFAPSALPLVGSLPQDGGHLQILSENPHHIFIHPPKVFPITPSPELSGPLLGGPPIRSQPSRRTSRYHDHLLLMMKSNARMQPVAVIAIPRMLQN